MKNQESVLKVDIEIEKDRIRKEIAETGYPKDVSLDGHFSPELCEDKDFILEVMKSYGPFISNAAETLKADKSFMLQAIQIWGHAFESTPIELQKDLDIRAAAQKWMNEYNQRSTTKTSIDLDKGIIREELTLPISHALVKQAPTLISETTNVETILSILKKSNIDVTGMHVENKFIKDRRYGDDMGNLGGHSDCILIEISKDDRVVYQEAFWAKNHK